MTLGGSTRMMPVSIYAQPRVGPCIVGIVRLNSSAAVILHRQTFPELRLGVYARSQ